MATRKVNKKLNIESLDELFCDSCGSTDVIDTTEGYVCKACGLVLEVQKLEYYRPYEDDLLQHAPLGATQIGFLKERLRNPNSYGLEKLNKLQSIQSNEKTVLEKAKIEISRIFNCLNLPDSLKALVFEKFKKIRAALRPGTKYRSPEKLVPLSIYFTLKYRNVSINESSLLEVSKISKKDFNSFKLQIREYVPKYAERNRKDYVLCKILEVAETLNLGMAFYYESKSVLYKLWESVKNTKDEVIAGLVASISALCSFKEKTTVNAICKKLGVKMSKIQFQVKKKIFEKFNVSGFSTLVKSSDLLKKVTNELGLISEKKEEPAVKPTKIIPDVIEIQLGNAVQVSNATDTFTFNYYAYAVRQFNGLPLFACAKLPFYESNGKISLKNYDKKHLQKLCYFEISKYKYSIGKGPPKTH